MELSAWEHPAGEAERGRPQSGRVSVGLEAGVWTKAGAGFWRERGHYGRGDR